MEFSEFPPLVCHKYSIHDNKLVIEREKMRRLALKRLEEGAEPAEIPKLIREAFPIYVRYIHKDKLKLKSM